MLIGHEGVAQALADLPYLPEDAPAAVLISDRVAAVAEIADEFEQAVASLGWNGGAIELLDQLAVGGAAAYLRNADEGGAIGLLHAVTSPLACELCCPGWPTRIGPPPWATPGRPQRPCTSPTTRTARPRCPSGRRPAVSELVERALDSGDEHAIKLCEAALRAFERTAEPALLLAAADAADRF